MELSYITEVRTSEEEHGLDQSAHLIITPQDDSRNGGVKLVFPEEYYRYYSVVEIARMISDMEKKRIYEILQNGSSYHWHTKPFRAFWGVGPAFSVEKAVRDIIESRIKEITSLDETGRSFSLLQLTRNALQTSV